jgi:hypothetical protein
MGRWGYGRGKLPGSQDCLGQGNFSQELSVSHGDSSRAIHFEEVLVVLFQFDDNPCVVPFSWVVPNLVLYAYMVTNCQREQPLRVLSDFPFPECA